MKSLRNLLSCLLALALVPVSAPAAGVQELMRSLPPKETVTEAEAVKSAAVLLGERAQAMNLAACEARLRERHVLLETDKYDSKRTLTKGFAAMLFARGMGLKGGWAARLSRTPMGPRLAYKELEFLNMVPAMGTSDIMTGGELLSLLKLAQDHVRTEANEKLAKAEYKKKQKERYGHGQ